MGYLFKVWARGPWSYVPISSTMVKALCFFPSKAEADYTLVDEDLLLRAVGTVTGDVDHPYFGMFLSLKYSEFGHYVLGRISARDIARESDGV